MSLETIALATAGVAAVGSVVSGAAQYGQSQRAANVAEANAQEARNQGEAEAALIRERAGRLRGQNRANAGASGVDISGSFADVLDDNDISAELDAQTAIRNSKVQANNFKAQAKEDRSSGGAALIGAGFGAGTQALSGYGNWRLLQTMKSNGGGYVPTVPMGGHGGAR